MTGSAEDARLNGIRGWLIVPAIALVGTGGQFDMVWLAPKVRTQSLRGVLGGMLICAVWIPYFIKSSRVDATFVR